MANPQFNTEVLKGSTPIILDYLHQKVKGHKGLMRTNSSFLEYKNVEQHPPSATSPLMSEINHRIVKLENDVAQLNQKVEKISEEMPKIVNTSINSLPSEKYEVRAPINVILKIYIDETLALIPELELYGEGKNEIEALNELKIELLDLIKDLEEIPEDKLGKNPKSWKRTLNKLVKQCQ